MENVALLKNAATFFVLMDKILNYEFILDKDKRPH